MREIKFRGRRWQGHSWIHGGIYINKNGRIVIIDDTGAMHEVVPETIGQYTGLQDRKGVEIYEGDLVRAHDFFGKPMGLYEVRFATFGFMMFDPAKPEEISYYNSELIEVVGNIHENPELLASE